MPRQIPRFDQALSHQAQTAIGIVRAGEITRTAGGPIGRSEWGIVRLEALHELAFLRIFSAWEMCLEAVFFRSLCGYASRAGQETLIRGSYFPDLAAAEAAVLGGQSFVLWHNPAKVITRCRQHIRSGMAGCPGIQESVIASSTTRLTHLAAIRHRIAHDQSDARSKFDAATLTFAGRTYPASRPGKFLRDWGASTPAPNRWLDIVTNELINLIAQIV